MAELTNLSINNNEVVDYIIEQSVTGIWTYRKYASGIAELWGISTGTYNISTAWGNIYYSGGQYSYAEYPFTFIEKPLVTYSIDNSNSLSVWVMTAGTVGSTTKTPILQFGRATAGSNCVIETHWHVIGRWK